MKRVLLLLLGVGIPHGAVADGFAEWDRDKDQKLSVEELPERLRKNFDRVDRDGDGWISRAEHDRATGRQKAGGRAAAPRVPEGYRAIIDIPYAGNDNPAQRLDLFLPEAKSGKPRALVVFIHGGGWRNGTKSGGANRCHAFDPEGKFAYASVEYRLSGEAKWPAQIHDCKAAIRWLRGNAGKYGIDPARIAVHGTSAGGHLVTMLGVSGGVEELEGDLGEFDGLSSRVTCVVNYFGPTNLLTMNDHPSKIDHDAADSPEGLLIGGAIEENGEKARSASPIKYVTRDDAPTLTAHGTKDPLVPFPQGEELEAALERAGVVSVLIPMQNGGHGFQSDELNGRVAIFLDRYLLGNDKTDEVSEEAIPMIGG